MRARREDDVTDVARERSAEVLSVEEALELALHPLVDVAALGVEEADLHAVGVSRGQPNGDPALRSLAAHLEAGQGHRGELEIHHVHTGQVETGDESALERACRTARVATRRDHGALLQRRAVGHGQADRHLGGDVDVRQAPNPATAEERARSPALPDHRGGDDRAGLDRLERIYLDPRVHDRVLADEALVTDDDALVGASPVSQVARPSDNRSAQSHSGPYVYVIVHDGPLQVCLRLHDDVGPEHRVGLEIGARLDSAVVADQHGPDHVRLGREVGALAEADAISDLESGKLDSHATVEDLPVHSVIRLERTDVFPVPVHDVPVQRKALLEHRREDVTGEVD